MKKILTILLLIVMFISFTSCGNNGGNNSPSNGTTPPDESKVNIEKDFIPTSKTLIVYFSKTNTTESVAKIIQSETDADIFKIERKEPYPDEYTPTTEIAKTEKSENARPELKSYLSKEIIAQYDNIIIGFPIWWSTAPMPVLSFLNFYDFSGKTIYTFCTSGSSSIVGSTKDIRSNAKGANIIEGKRFTPNDETNIKSWLSTIKLVNEEPTPQEKKILIAYFSGSGNTKKVAENIAEATNGTLFELVPVVPYTSADLNYSDSNSRVVREHNDESLRDIELVSVTPADFDEYDVVFIGYPIWWGIAAWPVNNFIKGNDFKDKIVIPFATSASSGIGQSDVLLRDMTTTGSWLSGRRFPSYVDKNIVENWVKDLNL